MNAPKLYEIRLAGHLSATWKARFEGLSVRLEPNGKTVLSGALDQAALHGVLVVVRDLGLRLVSVNPVSSHCGRVASACEESPSARSSRAECTQQE
jgi:hypothetical protein